MTVQIHTPLADEVVGTLRAGDEVEFTGVLYIARDAAHKRMAELIEEGKRLPFDPKGQVIYYAGPTPPKPGQVIGSVGPTTSGRMDPYTPMLLERGLKGVIGKGHRGQQVRESLKANRAVYFVALGGAGVLAALAFRSSEVIAWDDLGPEALRRVEVEGFPAFVAYDVLGGDIYSMDRK